MISGQLPEKTRSRKAPHPEWTPFQFSQSEMDSIPNEHHPECTQSRMLQFRMEAIPIVHLHVTIVT